MYLSSPSLLERRSAFPPSRPGPPFGTPRARVACPRLLSLGPAMLSLALAALGGVTSPHRRANPRWPLPRSYFSSSPGPAQYKLAMSPTGLRLQWVTQAAADSAVIVGTDPSALTMRFTGTAASYSCADPKCGGPYSSGHLHSVHLSPLEPSTKYYYRVCAILRLESSTGIYH